MYLIIITATIVQGQVKELKNNTGNGTSFWVVNRDKVVREPATPAVSAIKAAVPNENENDLIKKTAKVDDDKTQATTIRFPIENIISMNEDETTESTKETTTTESETTTESTTEESEETTELPKLPDRPIDALNSLSNNVEREGKTIQFFPIKDDNNEKWKWKTIDDDKSTKTNQLTFSDLKNSWFNVNDDNYVTDLTTTSKPDTSTVSLSAPIAFKDLIDYDEHSDEEHATIFTGILRRRILRRRRRN